MTNQEAIKILGYYDVSAIRFYTTEGEEIPFAEWSDAIEKAISALQAQEWIPSSERLPEVGKDVMVCYDFKGYRSVLIGVFYGDEKFHGYDDEYLSPEGRKYRKAVAWKPLPEPYKEEEHGQ